MVGRIDSPKIPAGGPGPKGQATPGAKPAEGPKVEGDALTLSRPAGQPTLGQTLEVRGGKIYASDTVKIDAEPERVMAAIEGDWSKWWPGGKVAEVPAGADLPAPEENERRFQFAPGEGKDAPKAYVVRQLMPTAEQAGNALMMVVPTKLSGGVTGEGRFEIRVTPDGKTMLTAKWDGVKPEGLPRFGGGGVEGAGRKHQALEKQALENLGKYLSDNP